MKWGFSAMTTAIGLLTSWIFTYFEEFSIKNTQTEVRLEEFCVLKGIILII